MRNLMVEAALLALLITTSCSKAPLQKPITDGTATNAGVQSPTLESLPRLSAPRIVITKRNIPSDFVYRGTNVTIEARPAELVIRKNRGPETIEALLDYLVKGDFAAWMTVEFASPEELGIGFTGGTPVPYYGFRSASGTSECYFLLATVHGKGKQYHILMRREAGKLAAFFEDNPQQGTGNPLPDAGYISFMMNDVSEVRFHYVRLESPPGKLLIEYGQSDQ